jgi:hypothetical protein
MPVIIVTIAALLLLAGPALAQGSTVVVPRTTITIDEQPAVVQPPSWFLPIPQAPTPSPEQRRRREQQTQQAPTATPAPPRPQGPQRPTNGYSSFLTGPIDLTRPPVPQQ